MVWFTIKFLHCILFVYVCCVVLCNSKYCVVSVVWFTIKFLRFDAAKQDMLYRGYTCNELADIHLVYGASHGNANEDLGIYQLQYPDRRLPNQHMFRGILVSIFLKSMKRSGLRQFVPP